MARELNEQELVAQTKSGDLVAPEGKYRQSCTTFHYFLPGWIQNLEQESGISIEEIEIKAEPFSNIDKNPGVQSLQLAELWQWMTEVAQVCQAGLDHPIGPHIFPGGLRAPKCQ